MSTPTRYQRLAPAERRDQILDAANTLFAERGYEEVLGRGHRARRWGHARAGAPLLRRPQGCLHRAGGTARRPPRGRAAAARRSQRSRASGGHGVTLAGLDRGEPNDLPRHDRTRRGHRRPRRAARGRRLVRRAVAQVAAFHADIAEDSPAPALCAGVLDRTEPGRDAALATRRGHPRGDAGAARLDPRTRPPHVRLATKPARHAANGTP